jgi:archaellum component FlaC
MEKDHLEILLEDIHGKFDLVLEGHDVLRKEIRDTREELCEKINSMDFKVETLNQKIDGVRDDLNQKIDGVRDALGQKIDAVASDLTAHRRDTEAHPSVYKVKEGN